KGGANRRRGQGRFVQPSRQPAMQRIGLTRAGVVLPIAAALQRVGANVERLLVRAGLPAWTLTDPEALIPTSSAARLIAPAGRAQGIDNLGLLAGQDVPIDALGIYGALIRRSRTLGEALEESVRSHPAFSSNGRMWIASRGESVQLNQAFVVQFDIRDEGWQQASHYILMQMLGVIRLAAGASWRPAEVSFQTREAAVLRDADALSAARVSFAQPATGITIPRALYDQPLRQPKAPLELTAERVRAWKASAPPHDFVQSIAQTVETLSWEGYPGIHLTADAVGMSVRTLQRHLAAAGVTHESLVGRSRFATAAAL